ncbi:MAG: hypothetical protein WBG92_08805, partial [Thiohalocapsa sp.]
ANDCTINAPLPNAIRAGTIQANGLVDRDIGSASLRQFTGGGFYQSLRRRSNRHELARPSIAAQS